MTSHCVVLLLTSIYHPSHDHLYFFLLLGIFCLPSALRMVRYHAIIEQFAIFYVETWTLGDSTDFHFKMPALLYFSARRPHSNLLVTSNEKAGDRMSKEENSSLLSKVKKCQNFYLRRSISPRRLVRKRTRRHWWLLWSASIYSTSLIFTLDSTSYWKVR